MKLNEVKFIGRLVRDAESKYMENGKIKQYFSLAINDDYKKAGSEEYTKRVYFANCVVYGKEYQGLTKGKRVIINGKFTTINYTTPNGEKRTLPMFEVFTLDYMASKEDDKDVAKDVAKKEIKEEPPVQEDDEEVILPF